MPFDLLQFLCPRPRCRLFWPLALLLYAAVPVCAAELSPRQPWTTSSITGSPEPPKPYRTEPAFPKLKFNFPLLMQTAPGSTRLFVAERKAKIYSFPNDPACETADLFGDLTDRGREIYGLAFHPKFEQNRLCYICYIADPKKTGTKPEEGTRVSRFTVRPFKAGEAPTLDLTSEELLLAWRAGGHNGGCLEFGPDGFLYITTGDAASPTPPDTFNTGQDVSDLLSSVLRIDVDRPSDGKRYGIPADNPLVKTPKARPEVFAYGLRNPWKLTFDKATGQGWIGDVGWEVWEMVYRLQPGANYGWSIVEGPQSVRPEAAQGPGPIVPPTILLPHSDAASVTGGYVYRGKTFPELVGQYIFGDYETRRLWAATVSGQQSTVSNQPDSHGRKAGDVATYRELAEPEHRIVAFGQDTAGEIYILDFDAGTIHTLARNENAPPASAFPRKLSETGLFADVAKQIPAAGVVPYEINAPQWVDSAVAQRWVALPGSSKITAHREAAPGDSSVYSWRLEFPADAVLAKTFSIEINDNPADNIERKLETQILHYTGRWWRGYTYRWNDDQTDAELVDAQGAEMPVEVRDASAPGGSRTLHWNFAGRGRCAQCHNSWAKYTLGFTLPQLDRILSINNTTQAQSQIEALLQSGVIVESSPQSPQLKGDPPSPIRVTALANPHDATTDLNHRARSYLHANCAHCHQFGAGGTADIDLRHTVPLGHTKLFDVPPVQGTFGIHDARLIAPGQPWRSVLLYRVAKTGRGRMPHIGSECVDEAGVKLLTEWIRSLPTDLEEINSLAALRALDEADCLARDSCREPWETYRIAMRLAQARGNTQPTEEQLTAAREKNHEETARRAAERGKQRADLIAKLLSTPASALSLSRAVAEEQLPERTCSEVATAAMQHADAAVRDLFERFVPESERPKKLGSVVDEQQLLNLPGDAARGRELFFATNSTCKNCHRHGSEGGQVGPELTAIGRKMTRLQLLESLLEPSKTIDPKFRGYLAELPDGRVLTGLLIEQTAELTVLRDAQGKEHRLKADEIDALRPQSQSLMPELLLRDLTAQQVADLLEFLVNSGP